MIERMRPMSAEPQDGAAVWVWWREDPSPSPLTFRQGAWEDGDGLKWNVSEAVGWTLRTLPVRPLEPDAPEPAPILPPTPQRLRLQIRSAAQESVALGIRVGEFLAMASIAHNEATKQAARATADEAQKGERSC
mgnify:CR=1 FL=1